MRNKRIASVGFGVFCKAQIDWKNIRIFSTRRFETLELNLQETGSLKSIVITTDFAELGCNNSAENSKNFF